MLRELGARDGGSANQEPGQPFARATAQAGDNEPLVLTHPHPVCWSGDLSVMGIFQNATPRALGREAFRDPRSPLANARSKSHQLFVNISSSLAASGSGAARAASRGRTSSDKDMVLSPHPSLGIMEPGNCFIVLTLDNLRQTHLRHVWQQVTRLL